MRLEILENGFCAVFKEALFENPTSDVEKLNLTSIQCFTMVNETVNQSDGTSTRTESVPKPKCLV